MDLQDDRRSDLQFGEISQKIIGFAFEVIVELEVGLPIHFGNPKLEYKRFTRHK